MSTHGEIWQARAAESIPEGSHVTVTHVDGLMLVVRQDSPATQQGAWPGPA
ncbi:MAG: NfeD family protein [Acidobacteria bacterium]|nr:NfeD family protein [Acidobacteriota bacterium]